MEYKIKTIDPPNLCFSCGNDLIKEDFDLFHKLTDLYTKENSPLGVQLSQEAAWKIILDGKLSKIYSRICCRTMFISDPYEYRQKMALYDRTKINEPVRFSA